MFQAIILLHLKGVLDFNQTLNYMRRPVMPGKKRQFIATLAAFFGTTIGVGIFALPYAYSESLTTSLLVLAAAGLILISLYTMYIELMLEKGMGLHQLPGIAGKVWGKKAKTIVAVALLFGRTGIMFLYTIILGDFGSLILENVFGLSVSPVLIAVVTTFIASVLVTRQVKVMSRIELYLSAVIVSIIGFVSIFGIISFANTSGAELTGLFAQDAVLDNPSFIDSLGNLGLIYGVTIGAMSGIAAIPALKKISRDKEVLTSATRVGTTLVVILYALFAIFVIISSDSVSADALHGLGNNWWVTLIG
jgi:amino acid permease